MLLTYPLVLIIFPTLSLFCPLFASRVPRFLDLHFSAYIAAAVAKPNRANYRVVHHYIQTRLASGSPETAVLFTAAASLVCQLCVSTRGCYNYTKPICYHSIYGPNARFLARLGQHVLTQMAFISPVRMHFTNAALDCFTTLNVTEIKHLALTRELAVSCQHFCPHGAPWGPLSFLENLRTFQCPCPY